MTKTTTSTSGTTQSYAAQQNSAFANDAPEYVTLEQRLRAFLDADKNKATRYWATVDQFKLRYENLTQWSDINLCKAYFCSLDSIMIDATMQRFLDVEHLCDIIETFHNLKINPVRVFDDPKNPGKPMCWDGQHTVLTLYTIAKYVLDLDPAECEVPVVMYPIKDRAQAREIFTYNNDGNGLKSLDAIDLFHQKISGVRADHSINPEWLMDELKQQYLEAADMFATDKKFGNIHMPGALTRLQELMRYDAVITKYFCQYFQNVCNSNRPVDSKESVFLYAFFDLCEKDATIDVDDEYISSVADALKVVGNNDFDAQCMWKRARYSYHQWYQQNLHLFNSMLGIRYPDELGITFLLAQIEKTGLPVPNYNNNYYPVPNGDLF